MPDPIDKKAGFVIGYIVAGNHIHVPVIFRYHHDAEGRLLAVFGSGLGAFNAISDNVLHQFDKDREDISDLRPVAGVVFQTLPQGISHGEKDVNGHITLIAEYEFIPQQQLAELEKPVKIHNAATVPQTRKPAITPGL